MSVDGRDAFSAGVIAAAVIFAIGSGIFYVHESQVCHQKGGVMAKTISFSGYECVKVIK